MRGLAHERGRDVPKAAGIPGLLLPPHSILIAGETKGPVPGALPLGLSLPSSAFGVYPLFFPPGQGEGHGDPHSMCLLHE